MILINDQPYLDMSHLANPDVLNELDHEITRGLVFAKNAFHSVGYELSRGDAALDLYDHQFKDVVVSSIRFMNQCYN